MRQIFGPLRVHYNYPTRRPKDRPDKLAVKMRYARDGDWETVMVPIEEHPLMVQMPIFRKPGILRGEPNPTKNQLGRRITVKMWDTPFDNTQKTLEKLADKYGAVDCQVFCDMEVSKFSRMIAKIAHSFSVAEFGINNFRPMLQDIILGNSQLFTDVIGGDQCHGDEDNDGQVHDVCFEFKKFEHPNLLIAKVQLFSNLGMPVYYVAVGKLP